MAPKRVKKVKVGPRWAAAWPPPPPCTAASRRQLLQACGGGPMCLLFGQAPRLLRHYATVQDPWLRPAHAAAPPPCPRSLQAKAPSQTFYFPFMAAPIPISLTQEDINIDLHIMQVCGAAVGRPAVLWLHPWRFVACPPAYGTRDTQPSA